jgi:hypothetical protein
MYYGYHPLYNPGDIFKYDTDKDLHGEMSISFTVRYNLAKLPEGQVRDKLQLALQRGYISSTSGKAFKIYCLLASCFDFPVFALGQGGSVILSFPKADPQHTHKMRELADQVYSLAKLAAMGGYVSSPSQGRGHNPNWVTLQLSRPKNLSQVGLCNLLGAKSVGELVPKEPRQRALQALIKGETLEIKKV